MNAPLPDSPYLSRLVAAIDSARDPAEAACLRVERAGFLARQGFFDVAATEIDAVRAQFAARPNAGVTAWLCIAEAWIAHFRTLDKDAAHDKMKRALALSSAMKLTRLQALSAAWLAHFDFVRDDMESMAKNLSLALRTADPNHHAAQARIGMVAALAYDFANSSDLAAHWYSHARVHGLSENDTATLGAVTYNITANRAIRAFQKSIFGGEPEDFVSSALAGVRASQGAVDLFGTIAQDSLLPIVRAMLSSAQGNYIQAVDLYERNLEPADKQGFGHMRATHLADLAWCKFHLGDAQGALRDAEAAASQIDLKMLVEDRAEAYGRLAQVFQLLGHEERSLLYSRNANDDRAKLLRQHEWVLQLMNNIFTSAA